MIAPPNANVDFSSNPSPIHFTDQAYPLIHSKIWPLHIKSSLLAAMSFLFYSLIHNVHFFSYIYHNEKGLESMVS
jgi:hypothetical protein